MLTSSLPLLLLFGLAGATTFTVTNRCSYTIWPAATAGGGRELGPGQSWTVSRADAAGTDRFWARTGCSFDAAGKGRCATGDCGGVLSCSGRGSPAAPVTMVEYSLFQYGDDDFYDVSLVDGFNVPVEIRPKTGECLPVRCAADVAGECPAELKVAGGCKSACDVYKTNEYCCNNYGTSCGPTNYSRFFKNLCPDAYSYPLDDPTSTFTCKSGGDYTVTFCP